jgi:hypothetical protein
LYNYGGIYFDTDVEVIKPFDDILTNGGFVGLESAGKVATGLGLGCNAGLGLVHQILDFYAGLRFINADGSYNLHTVVEYVTSVLEKNGLKEENAIQYLDQLTVYPMEYFCPMNFKTGEINITEKTHSIHYYDGSWLGKYMKRLLKEKAYINNKFKNKIIIILLEKICVLKKIFFEGLNI